MAQQRPKYAYFKGQIVPLEDAKVSVMTHALHYGTGAFAGMRAFWNDDEEQLFMFRPDDHFERLLNSAALLRMDLGHTVASLKEVLTQLLRAEGFRENCYIRPLVYKSEEGLGVSLHDIESDLTMFATPVGNFLVRNDDSGIHVCISGWRRVDDNMIPARGKVSGAYANSNMAKTDAMLAGFDDALLLNVDGHISEATAANVVFIRKGVAITPPITANILEGITRRSVIQWLQEDLNIEVQEREIDRTEVYLAEEIFLCGTGAQVAPVSRVDHRVVGEGKIGPITRRLRDHYVQVVTGRVPKYRSWVTPVYATEPETVR